MYDTNCPRVSTRRRHRFAATLAVTVLLTSFTWVAPVHGAVKKPKVPVAGATCAAAAATFRTAKGARLDCVRVGSKLQWQPRGTRANPLGWGEAALVATEYARWQITVTAVEPDVTAVVLAPDERNLAPRPGAQYVGLRLSLTYVGTNPEERVRQGVSMLALVGSSAKGIDRATPGAATDDDCWFNETVAKGSTKSCLLPFEIDTAQLPSLVFYAAKVVGTPVVYFSALPPRA